MHLRAILLAFAFGPAFASAADPVVNDEFFENKVRPLLVTHCTTCHGAEKQKGGLRLDSRAAALQGGDTGPAFTPGDAEKSLLARMIRYDDDIKMPPKGKLAAEDTATLTAWIKGGAPWPGNTTPAAGPKGVFDVQARARGLWSFQPVKRPAVPTPRAKNATIRTPIDAFLLAKLDAAGLTFAPPAEKRVLLRRVYFDLIGLPPTPDEITAFENDSSPDAYEKVVDQLLASPHYGERWGRHWLDLARYAETQGHEFDYIIPDAWRYRDYVIRAFNADLPYNQFLAEQIAGDLLPNPRRNPKDGSNEALTATGFWWLGEAKHSPVDSRAEYADRTDNQLDVFGKAVLGLTIACARCHDHKFDPISTKDYYALFGVLSSSRYAHADVSDPATTVKVLDELKTARAELAALSTGAERPTLDRIPNNDWRKKATAFETFDTDWRTRWDAAGLALRPEAGDGFPHSGREADRLTGALRSPTFTIEKPFLAVRAAGRNGKARLILNGLQLIQAPIYGGLAQKVNHGEELRWVVFDLRMWKGQPAYLELLDDGPGYVAVREAWFADSPPPADPPEKVALPVAGLPTNLRGDPEAKKRAERIRDREAKIPGPQFAVTIRDGVGRNERVFIRGNHKTPGIEAPRAFLEVFGQPNFAANSSGRAELVRAVTASANPLTARVLVNRVWKHHFGEGIVRSPDDFGYQGQRPTHPELLDWLAAEFVEPTYKPHRSDGGALTPWSIKHLHRLMVLSTAYRQSSRATPEQAARAVTADARNELLYRQNVRRLEAEAIRDALLAVSGRLDRTMEGPGVLPYLTEHQVGRGRPSPGPLDGNGRRSVYLQARRNFLNPFLVAFDYPTPFTTIGRRSVSNVPAQALALLNNPFVIQQADLWAKRVLAEPGLSPADRVRGMYRTAFGRLPTAGEVDTATTFVTEAAREYGQPDHPKAWADLAHALFNAKEFLFVE